MNTADRQVGIVLLNYNNSTDDTAICVKSLLNSGCNLSQICIVDNGSTDCFKVLLAKQIPDGVTILWSKENSGFAGGCNTGIRYFCKNLDVRYILLLNNDTVVCDAFLKNLMEPFESGDDQIGIVSPLIYYSEGLGKLWYGGGKRRRYLRDYQHNRRKEDIPKTVFAETMFGTGCCMVFPKALLEKVGMLDEDYFMYIEDLDFNLRVKKAGYKILLNTKTYIFHKCGASISKTSALTYLYISNSGKLFIHKNYLGAERMLHYFLFYAGHTFGSVKLMLRGKIRLGVVVFKSMVIPMFRGMPSKELKARYRYE